jgi:putative ABC transport system permease protein
LSGIAARLRQQYPDTNKYADAGVLTFNERYNGGPIRVVFLMLLGAVGFVLLIACANVANLLLSRSVHRAREIAVRVALGASRFQVVRQLLIESALLACLGGLFGIGLTFFGVRLFDASVSNVGKPYWIVFQLDLWVLVYFAAICLATGVLFGLAPALQVSRANVNEILKDGGRGSGGSRRARRLSSTMVVGELALTLILLAGAGLMVRSFLALYSMDLGVESGHLLTMRTELSQQKYATPEHRQLFVDALLPRLRAVPGVANAAVASNLPLNGGEQRAVIIAGRPALEEGQAEQNASVLACGA